MIKLAYYVEAWYRSAKYLGLIFLDSIYFRFVLQSRLNNVPLRISFSGAKCYMWDVIHSVGPEVYGICACTFF